MRRALLVVDVQNDFCEGGSLAVAGGAEVAFKIGQVLHHWSQKDIGCPEYAVAVAVRDHHVDPGGHFAAPGTDPDFVDSWPVHCVVGTDGEAFHPNLDPQPFNAVFLKGEHGASFSGFEGRTTQGKGLSDWLREHEITDVDICGLTTDYCVRHTTLDALKNGFNARVLADLCAGVGVDTSQAALAEVRGAGATVT